MFRGFGGFDDDPFFSAHQQHMREMDRMMGGFGPFGGFGFGSPFGSPFGMLEGPRERGEGRNREERGMVPRDRPRDPFQSMFGNMHSMMSQMHRNFDNMQSNPDGFSYSSSRVMSYSSDGRNPPKYFEASSSTKRAPGGVKETQKTVRDSESGLHKMAVGHHIGERGHVIEKSRNTKNDTEEQKQDFYGIDEEDAASFDKEFKDKTRNFGHYNEISGFDDSRRRHHGEHRSRATPALGNGNHHREREGRERHHAAREGNHAEERKHARKEKKVKLPESESHL